MEDKNITDQDFLKWLGQRIRELRIKEKKTLEEVAAAADVHKTTLSTFERHGGQIKGIDIIKRIVEATGHTMADVFAEKKTSTICPA